MSNRWWANGAKNINNSLSHYLRTASTTNSSRGFTIVELLIVIIVIGILAAIIVVAYQGVTAKANATKAQTNADSVVKKAEAYNADSSGGNGTYPACDVTGTTCTAGFMSVTGLGAMPTGITAQPGAPTSTNGTTTVQYLACGESSVNAAHSATGYVVGWWNFSSSAVNYYVGGSATGAGGSGNGTYTSYTCPATVSTL